MYITGGIGSSTKNEGFTVDYDLPNESAYAETCASIDMVYWNNRMNLLTSDAKYIDIMERAMFNGVLSGISLSGDLFFYVNPLESAGKHHRQSWFGCACCPSNISRFLPSVGNYVYTTGRHEVFANIYMQSKAEFKVDSMKLPLSQQTNYPWDGQIKITVKPEVPMNFKFNLRIPGWCKTYAVKVNGKPFNEGSFDKGYLTVNRLWKKGDIVDLDLDMPVELVAADPRVKADEGKRAVQRGPLVYCLEETDNTSVIWENIGLSDLLKFQPVAAQGKLSGITLLQTRYGTSNLTFVPYYSSVNNLFLKGQMEFA